MKRDASSAPRFFVSLELAPDMAGQALELPKDVAHHAARVVRLSVGESLRLFTGEGGEYVATLTRIDKRGASVRIDRFNDVERESPLQVTLAQAIVASDAMDHAIRKATELGVAAIQPLVTARSAAIPAGDRAEKRHAHWQQVAIAACEQCGRNRVPSIAAVSGFDPWLAAWRGSGLMLAPDASSSLAALASPSPPIALMVGPEGGWLPSEVRAAENAGWKAVRLGARVLRADTAGSAALAALQTLWGDFR